MLNKKVVLVEITSPLGKLVQDELILPDGERRHRGFQNLSETVEPGEKPLDAAVRGIMEELGLNISISRFRRKGTKKVTKPSPTTGKVTHYEFSLFSLLLTAEEATQVPSFTTEDDGNVITFYWYR